MDLSSVLDLFTGGVAGGISGIIGSVATGWFKLKVMKAERENKKLDNDYKLEEIRETSKAIIAEAEANMQITRIEKEGELELTEAKTLGSVVKAAMQPLFKESYMEKLPGWAAGTIAFLFALMDIFKSMIRPSLTLYAMVLVTWLAAKTYQLNPKAVIASADMIVTAIIYMAVSAFTFWFLDRRMEKFLMEKYQ